MDKEKINILSETEKLEDWWTYLWDNINKKNVKKMWAIEKAINNMWRRRREYDSQ